MLTGSINQKSSNTMKANLGNTIKICFFVVLWAMSLAVAAEQVLYVQSAQAKLMAAPDFNAAALQVLEKGASVTVVKEQGRWLQVHTQSADGWIPKLLLANHPPIEKFSVLKGNQEHLEKSARRRASTNVTAAATRGLRSDDRTRISDQGQPDYTELEKMEAVDIPTQEVLEFQRETASP